MVTQCGMSEKVGKVFVKDQKEEGDEMRAAIDSEVRQGGAHQRFYLESSRKNLN